VLGALCVIGIGRRKRELVRDVLTHRFGECATSRSIAFVSGP